MSTYLQLVNSLKQECGVTGAALTTVASQTGEYKRLVDWVAAAWLEIATMHPDWRFLRKTVSFALTASQQEYAYAAAPLSLTDFGSWRRGHRTFRVWPTGNQAGETFLGNPDYEDFREYYLFGSRRTETGQPIDVAVSPTDSLLFGPIPNATGWSATGDYYRSAESVALSADADVPACPARFHSVILYRAMKKYGLYEAAPEVLARAEDGENFWLSRLEADQLEPVALGGPLA